MKISSQSYYAASRSQARTRPAETAPQDSYRPSSGWDKVMEEREKIRPAVQAAGRWATCGVGAAFGFALLHQPDPIGRLVGVMAMGASGLAAGLEIQGMVHR